MRIRHLSIVAVAVLAVGSLAAIAPPEDLQSISEQEATVRHLVPQPLETQSPRPSIVGFSRPDEANGTILAVEFDLPIDLAMDDVVAVDANGKTMIIDDVYGGGREWIVVFAEAPTDTTILTCGTATSAAVGDPQPMGAVTETCCCTGAGRCYSVLDAGCERGTYEIPCDDCFFKFPPC